MTPHPTHPDTPERIAQLEAVWKSTWFGVLATQHAQGKADEVLFRQTIANLTPLQIKELIVECDALKLWLVACLPEADA
jgi:hypothetical protein